MTLKQVIIIRTKYGQKYADYIGKEINKAGYKYFVTDLKNLNNVLRKNKCSPKNTLIHARTAHPGYVYKALKNLKTKGYKVINSPRTIRLTSDKFNSCAYARKNKIPCAETISVKKKDAEKIIRSKIKKWGEVVVKPTISQGQGIYCLRFDEKNLNEITKIPTKNLVVQQFIDYSKLSRVIVIGGKSLKKAVFWDTPSHSWKCSVCLNPKIKHYKKPPKKLLKLAETIAQKFNSEIGFIDIFTTRKGYILNEINTACNLIIHEKISKYNIAREIAQYLLTHFK